MTRPSVQSVKPPSLSTTSGVKVATLLPVQFPAFARDLARLPFSWLRSTGRRSIRNLFQYLLLPSTPLRWAVSATPSVLRLHHRIAAARITATWIAAHPCRPAPASGIAVPKAVVFRFAFEIRWCKWPSLARSAGIHRVVHRFLAATVRTVGKDYQRLAASLGLHQLIPKQIDGIVNAACRRRLVPVSSRFLSSPSSPAPAHRYVQPATAPVSSNSRCSFFAGVGKVLQQLKPRGQSESGRPGLCSWRPGRPWGRWAASRQQIFPPPCARPPSLRRRWRWYPQASWRKGRLLSRVKALDGLWPPILGQRKVARLQRGHQRAVFVPHGHWKQHLSSAPATFQRLITGS